MRTPHLRRDLLGRRDQLGHRGGVHLRDLPLHLTKKLKGGWPLQLATVAFIVVSLAVYLSIGTAPAAILVFVGGFNG